MSAAPPRRLSASQRIEIVAALLLLTVAVAGVVYVPDLVSGWAFAMPGTTDTALSPTFFPTLIFTLLGCAAVNMGLTALMRTAVLPLLEMSRSEWGRMLGVAILVVVYLVGLNLVGFVIASAIFVIAVNAFLGNRNYLAVVSISVIAPLMISVAFRYGLNVILPPSALGIGF
jgi:putative tricarboxylic transport membrane protein